MTVPYLTVTMSLRDVEAADIERLFRVLHEMGGVFVSVQHPENSAIPLPPEPPVDIPAPPLPPEPNWWETLKLTEPKTKIYAARAGVQIYYSDGIEHPPSFDQTELTSTGQLRILPFGAPVEVWRAPLPLSGWICVHVNLERALWVRGEDMRATP